MKPIIRNILAVVVAVIAGGSVNMGLVKIGPYLIPPPEGVDLTTMEGLTAGMPLMEPKHFLMPFLAHALGTLIGAIVVIVIAGKHQMKLAYGIAAWYLLGGIIMVYSLPSPLWFSIIDLVCAYFPMAFIAGKIMNKKHVAN